jgi:Concanavalin A-like lectin/glucanases superfamily
MPARLTCPHCGISLRLESEVPTGKKIRCRHCQAVFPVSQSSSPGRDDDERESPCRSKIAGGDAGFRPAEGQEEKDWNPDDRPARKPPRKKRKGRRRPSLLPHPVLIGSAVSVLLFGLALLLAEGRYHVPFVLLGVMTGVLLVLWVVILGMTAKDVSQSTVAFSLVITAAFFLGGWGLTSAMAQSNRTRYLESSGLQARLSEYVSAGQTMTHENAAYRGKVVFLEKENRPDYRFQDLHFGLPEDLWPHSDDEVGTVVLMDRDRKVVGQYTDHYLGYQWVITVQFIDYRRKVCFHSRVFTGSMPPEYKTSSDTAEGNRPDREVKEWLSQIPRESSESQPIAAGPVLPPNPGGKPAVPLRQPAVPLPAWRQPPTRPWTRPNTPPPASTYPGLVAYWAFDEGNGTTAIDASPNQLRGTVVGARWVPGIRGQALAFNGTTDYFDLGTSPVLDMREGAPFTVAAWVKSDDRRGTIVSFRHETQDSPVLDVHLNSSGLVLQARHNQREVFADELRSPPLIRPDEWHHFAVVRDLGPTLELFLDGASAGKMQAVKSRGEISTNLRCLGFEKYWQKTRFSDVDGRWLRGAVDEFCVFNRALTAAEITGLAGRGP